MGSCEPSFSLINDSLNRSPCLLTDGVAKGLLGSSLPEECRKLELRKDEAHEVSRLDERVAEQSIPDPGSCSEVALSKDDVGTIDMPGQCLGSPQDYDFFSVTCTSFNSSGDCKDVSIECPGFFEDFDTSFGSLSNGTDMPCVNRSSLEDGHLNSLLEVPEGNSCDRYEATELCSSHSQSRGCEEVTNSSILATARLSSKVSPQYEDRSGNTSEACGVHSELFSVIAYAEESSSDDDKNIVGCSGETVSKFMRDRNDVLDGTSIATRRQVLPPVGTEISARIEGSPSRCGQEKEQDTGSACSATLKRIMVATEAKDDVQDRINDDLCIRTLTAEKNACSLDKGSSGIALYAAVDRSDTVQSCQSLNLVENGSLNHVADENPSGAHALLCAFNSNSVLSSFVQRDLGVKDYERSDSVPEVNSSDMICICPRRSARISNSGQKSQTKMVSGKRKKSKNLLRKRDIMDILSKAARRKRSCFCKPARSSSWGLLGNIAHVFQQYNGLDVSKTCNTQSQRAKGTRRVGKHKRNQADGYCLGQTVEVHASVSRIRLKVRVGKELSQNSLEVIVPKAVDTLSSSPATRPQQHSGTSAEVAEAADRVKYNTKTHEDVCLLDVCPASKDVESTVCLDSFTGNALDTYCGISSQFDVETLGGTVDHNYIDSGTSPDSEVINLAPDAQAGMKIQEVFQDGTLTSSTIMDAHGDVTSPNLSNCHGRNGTNCILDAKKLARKSKIRLSMKHRRKGKTGNGLTCSENFGSSTGKNASSNKESPKGIPPSLTIFGKCQGAQELEYSTDASLHTGPQVCVGSALQSSENLLPSLKVKERKVSQSSKCDKKKKNRSEASGSAKSRRNGACGQNKSQLKLGKKEKIRDNDLAEQVICSSDGYLEKGKHIVDDLGQGHIASKVASEDLTNADKISSGLETQFLQQRIAWVSCDDCHKWRCIPAKLADTIEETNCKWTCKDNMDKAFADCSVPQEKSNAEINAELQISDASGEEDANDAPLNSKHLERRHPTAVQNSSWTLIKSNMFLHRSRKKQTIDEIMVCHCKPPKDGRMGCGNACLNRMLNIECVQGTCPCGDLCSNQQFQKRKYVKMKSIRCGRKGYGLQLQEDIAQGQFLIEYVGEVLDLPAYEARQRDYASKGHRHFYFMTLNGSEVIDACAKGNLGRFINHSCDPNCRTEKWMVNGEVCVGLFAVRDIKKGEELTFDYNYVRVFGAAAKKCICGSSQCRGYIGGDPLNAEVIVQGDSDEEYPEPLMISEDVEVGDRKVDVISSTDSHDDAELKTVDNLLRNKVEMDQQVGALVQVNESSLPAADVLQYEETLLGKRGKTDLKNNSAGQLNIMIENEELGGSTSVVEVRNLLEIEDSVGKLALAQAQPVEVSPQSDDFKSKCTHAGENIALEEETSKKSLCSTQKIDTYTPQRQPKTIYCKSDTVEPKQVSLKLNPLSRASRTSSSIKKGKSSHNELHTRKPQMVSISGKKGKSTQNGSPSASADGVEVMLNELLDDDGGISRRKDATRGYLKLLFLTVASGNQNSGESIQSTRDLSMILDALLKTKSRAVLVDIINKNGPQMLHNIMKKYRRDFNKTPVLRKLLKVLEYLGVREILTSEHINGGPPCPGMESFRESILALTEHADKQVHQIARSFRDRWIPWSLRKFGCMDRDDGKMDLQKGLNCKGNFGSRINWHEQGMRNTEAIDRSRQPMLVTTATMAGDQESSSLPGDGGCLTNITKPRKRKSRWDQPAETNSSPSSLQKDLKVQTEFPENLESTPQPEVCGSGSELCVGHNITLQDANQAVDKRKSIHGDFPPGFSSPLTSNVDPPNAFSATSNLPQHDLGHLMCPQEVVVGDPGQKFNSRFPVAYGIPLLTMKQYGAPQAEIVDSWVIAPGMPFHPFPPLPPLPRDKQVTVPNYVVDMTNAKRPREVLGPYCSAATSQTDHNTPSTSGACQDVNVQDRNHQHAFKRNKDASYDLGRKFFRQQKANLRSGPPWKRNGWRSIGNYSRNGFCNTAMENAAGDGKTMYSSEDASCTAEISSNSFYQHQNQS